jgi:hypothetical protein
MDFLAADGSCDIGTIPIAAGPMYVHAATANDRVTFARVSKAHSSPSMTAGVRDSHPRIRPIRRCRIGSRVVPARKAHANAAVVNCLADSLRFAARRGLLRASRVDEALSARSGLRRRRLGWSDPFAAVASPVAEGVARTAVDHGRPMTSPSGKRRSRRHHHAVTADLALHERVRVAFDELALCPGCHVSTWMLTRWIDLRDSYHRGHKCEVVTLLLRWWLRPGARRRNARCPHGTGLVAVRAWAASPSASRSGRAPHLRDRHGRALSALPGASVGRGHAGPDQSGSPLDC